MGCELESALNLFIGFIFFETVPLERRLTIEASFSFSVSNKQGLTIALESERSVTLNISCFKYERDENSSVEIVVFFERPTAFAFNIVLSFNLTGYGKVN